MTQLTRLTLAAAAFFSLAFSGIGPPSPGTQDNGVLEVDTQLVLIDVIVQSEDGPVSNLTAEDFTVLDRGTPQPISIFEVRTGDPEPGPVAALPAGVASNRMNWSGSIPTTATVVLIDRVNTPTAAQVFANSRLKEFLGAFDQTGGVALYELRSDGLRILHDFTADPQALVRVAGTLEPEHSLTLEGSDSLGGFESDLASVGVDRRLAEEFHGGTGFSRQSSDYFLNDRALKTSAALEAIVLRLEGLKGRKNIVWLSGRFPFTFDVWTRTDLAEEIEPSTMRQIEQVGIRITEANVAIYPVDVRGPDAEGADVRSVMENISKTTGARLFRTNDVGRAISAAVQDAQMVYTLGFYPTEVTTDGSFREVQIDVGQDLDLRYRPGYFAFGGSNVRGTRVGLVDILSGSVDAGRIGLTGFASLASDDSGGYSLVTLVDVRDLALVQTSGRRLGVVDLGLLFRADDDGTIYVFPPTSHSVNLSEEQFQAGWFVIQKGVDTNGRTGGLRIAVQDQATGAAGSMWVRTGLD